MILINGLSIKQYFYFYVFAIQYTLLYTLNHQCFHYHAIFLHQFTQVCSKIQSLHSILKGEKWMFLKKIVREGKLYNFSSKYAASVGQGKGNNGHQYFNHFQFYLYLFPRKSLLYSKCGKMHKIGAHYHFRYVC